MLKPNRYELHHDIRWFCDTVSERGGIVSLVTAGSGGYPGDRNAVVAYANNASGAKPIGLLLQDVITYDTNRQHENWEKGGFQARKGMKVLVAKDGWYETNMIPTGDTPVGGESAYLASGGNFSVTQATGAPKVGQFLSAKDQDGYAAVRVEL